VSLESVMCCPGRGLCDGLIARPEESYRVSECGREVSMMGLSSTRGGCAMGGKTETAIRQELLTVCHRNSNRHLFLVYG
jgi:hypothetical protein